MSLCVVGWKWNTAYVICGIGVIWLLACEIILLAYSVLSATVAKNWLMWDQLLVTIYQLLF